MEKKSASYLPAAFLAVIVIASGLFLWNGARGDSGIMDELAHIPAGYTYARFLDYRLNPEHPPLVKALAAIPLLPLHLTFPENDASWASDVNGQWDAGTKFLYGSGNDANQIVKDARIAPIFLTLLTIVLVYLFAAELLGAWWGLVPAFLFGLSPSVLAHGHYVTTDIGAAFGILIGVWAFLSFLLHPSGKRLVVAGLALGIAELTKFSTVLLVPFLFALAVIFWIAETKRTAKSDEGAERFSFYAKRGWYYLRSYVLVLVIAYALVYAVYAVVMFHEPAARQLADAETILRSYSPKVLKDIDLFLVKTPLLRPLGHYMQGILMVLTRSTGGNTAYFLGTVSNTGWWYYFPVVFTLKEPLPSLLLILIASLFTLAGIVRNTQKNASIKRTFGDYLGTHFPEFSILLFVVFYVGYSMHSALNIGFRHLFPVLPFIYILTAAGLKNWMSHRTPLPVGSAGYGTSPFTRIPFPKTHEPWHAAKIAALTVLLLWFGVETAVASPYFLSYFNELGGGTWYGFRSVTDSNYDWGQDLTRLAAWTKENRIETIAVDYFGGGNPHYAMGNTEVDWRSSLGDPRAKNIEWLAVSVNILSQAFGQKAPWLDTKPEDNYAWLADLKPKDRTYGQIPVPDARAGTSIFIYHL